MSPEEFEAKIREDKKGCMTSTPLGHKNVLTNGVQYMYY
jgi:hypothetical protein